MLRACTVCGKPARGSRCPLHTIPGRPGQRERARQRTAIINRDGYACAHCGTINRPLIVDHIIALADGGTNELSNLRLLCGGTAGCHAQRHSLQGLGHQGGR